MATALGVLAWLVPLGGLVVTLQLGWRRKAFHASNALMMGSTVVLVVAMRSGAASAAVPPALRMLLDVGAIFAIGAAIVFSSVGPTTRK